MSEIEWDISKEGRAWEGDEAGERYKLNPRKDRNDSKLFWSDEERLNMLNLLLVNVCVDKAIHLEE